MDEGLLPDLAGAHAVARQALAGPRHQALYRPAADLRGVPRRPRQPPLLGPHRILSGQRPRIPLPVRRRCGHTGRQLADGLFAHDRLHGTRPVPCRPDDAPGPRLLGADERGRLLGAAEVPAPRSAGIMSTADSATGLRQLAADADQLLDRRRGPLVTPATKIVIAAACLVSVAAYLHFYPHGQTIAYGDAKSHLLIARRVLFAGTPGAGQLGGVWLPLPHILMLPLIWNNWAFYSGFAGSAVMMAAYVVCSVLVYKFVWQLTRRHWAAAAGTAVFALNPNVLYMQGTPMTELLMFAAMMGAAYGLLRWTQTGHHLYLLGAGFSALLCALTRYEGWTLAVALTAVVLYGSLTRLRLAARLVITGLVTACPLLAAIGVVRLGWVAGAVIVPAALLGYAWLRRRYHGNDWDGTEGKLLTFGILGATGPLAWMSWNWAIFGSAFAFQNGAYAKPSLWVDSGEKAVHNIWISLRTYEIATVDNVTPLVTVLAVAGLLVYLWRFRRAAQ